MMERHARISVVERMRLASPQLGFWVDVQLVTHEDRWLAVALVSGDPEIGLGNSPQEAIRDSLSTLGRAAASLLAATAGTS